MNEVLSNMSNGGHAAPRYTGVIIILGLYWDNGKKMETAIMGLYGV